VAATAGACLLCCPIAATVALRSALIFIAGRHVALRTCGRSLSLTIRCCCRPACLHLFLCLCCCLPPFTSFHLLFLRPVAHPGITYTRRAGGDAARRHRLQARPARAGGRRLAPALADGAEGVAATYRGCLSHAAPILSRCGIPRLLPHDTTHAAAGAFPAPAVSVAAPAAGSPALARPGGSEHSLPLPLYSRLAIFPFVWRAGERCGVAAVLRRTSPRGIFGLAAAPTRAWTENAVKLDKSNSVCCAKTR